MSDMKLHEAEMTSTVKQHGGVPAGAKPRAEFEPGELGCRVNAGCTPHRALGSLTGP